MTIKNRGGVFGRNPTFNDVDVDGTLTVGGNAVPAANTILVDGDIGVTVQAYDAATAKTNVSQTFTALQNFNFAGGGNYVATFQTTTTATPYTVNIGETSGSAAGYPLFRVGQSYAPYSDYFRVNSQGNIYATGGIYIGGTAAANELDDYEEGTWTPVFSGVTGGSQRGTYTKVGDLVTAYGYMEAGTATAVTASVSGLPFVAGTEKGAVHSWYNDWIPTSSGGWVFQSNTVILFTTDNSTSTQNAASGTKSCHFVAIYKT
jgi:hypothetical protein